MKPTQAGARLSKGRQSERVVFEPLSCGPDRDREPSTWTFIYYCTKAGQRVQAAARSTEHNEGSISFAWKGRKVSGKV